MANLLNTSRVLNELDNTDFDTSGLSASDSDAEDDRALCDAENDSDSDHTGNFPAPVPGMIAAAASTPTSTRIRRRRSCRTSAADVNSDDGTNANRALHDTHHDDSDSDDQPLAHIVRLARRRRYGGGGGDADDATTSNVNHSPIQQSSSASSSTTSNSSDDNANRGGFGRRGRPRTRGQPVRPAQRGVRGRGGRGGRGGRARLQNVRASHRDHTWSEVAEGFTPVNNIPAPSPSSVGPAAENVTEPIDCAKLFLDDVLISHLVTHTNLYADQTKLANPVAGPYSFVTTWSDTNATEMRQFLGLTFLMGLTKKPYIRDYWSTNPLHSAPVFPAVMTRNRYQSILKFLHFNDNQQAPDRADINRDRLYKLRPLLTMLEDRFQALFLPSANVSIDECLLLWKGRLLFRQYIPLKRARFGIKMYALCDSDNGYTFRFRIYTGAEDPVRNIDNDLPQEVRNMLTSEKVVLWLMLPLLDKGYQLYTDNYYTSVPLASYLNSRGTGLTGTIRSNRIPLCVKDVVCEAGKSTAFSNNDNSIMLMKYKDKKDVHVLTTKHPNTETVVKNKTKPTAVVQYNKNMGGVDKTDQLIEPYNCARKTLKWYRKLAISMLQRALLNAHIVYIQNGGTINFKKFQEEVIASLIFPDPDETVDDVLLPRHECFTRLSGSHYLEYAPISEKTGRPLNRKCKVCTKQGKRKESCFICNKCSNHPALCVAPCFEKYHTRLVYWK